MSTLRLQGKTIGYLVGPEVEDLEYWVPLMRLREEGARVISIGITNEPLRGKHGLEITPDVGADEAPTADELDGLVIPGGWAPDKMRRNPHMLQLVREMDARGKIIGAICHAGWVPISAGIMRGRKAMTGWCAVTFTAPTSARSTTPSTATRATGLSRAPRSSRARGAICSCCDGHME